MKKFLSFIYRRQLIGEVKMIKNKMRIFYERVVIVFVVLSFIGPGPSYPQAPKEQKMHNEGLSGAPRVSLDVKNMDIVNVLKILAEKGNLSLSISGDVHGRVTLFLKDVDLWDALDIVLISSNLACEKTGQITYVMTGRNYELKYGVKYEDKREVKVFNLRHAQAQRVKGLLMQVASKIGKVIVDEPTKTLVAIDIPKNLAQMGDIVKRVDKPLETKIFNLNYLLAGEIEPKITDILTKDTGSVKINEATNKVIVTDYPKKLRAAERLIQAFDEKPLQVLINAKIIEINPSKKFYSGVDWDYWIRKYFRLAGTFTLPVASSDKFSLGTIGRSVGEKGDYKGIIEFLEIFGDTKVLSSPRILALNNREAKILVGERKAYITSSTSQIGESAVTSHDVNFVDVGVKLYVTPTINRDRYITLKIRPEVSTADFESITSEGKITQVPLVTTSEAETVLMVKDGVGIIIGGLRRISHEKEEKRVPFLGSIPFLGGLFRSKKDEWAKNELVIFLTPQIVTGDESIETEFNKEMKEVIEAGTSTKKGLGRSGWEEWEAIEESRRNFMSEVLRYEEKKR